MSSRSLWLLPGNEFKLLHWRVLPGLLLPYWLNVKNCPILPGWTIRKWRRDFQLMLRGLQCRLLLSHSQYHPNSECLPRWAVLECWREVQQRLPPVSTCSLLSLQSISELLHADALLDTTVHRLRLRPLSTNVAEINTTALQAHQLDVLYRAARIQSATTPTAVQATRLVLVATFARMVSSRPAPVVTTEVPRVFHLPRAAESVLLVITVPPVQCLPQKRYVLFWMK